jgi:hypothetical protein
VTPYTASEVPERRASREMHDDAMLESIPLHHSFGRIDMDAVIRAARKRAGI